MMLVIALAWIHTGQIDPKNQVDHYSRLIEKDTLIADLMIEESTFTSNGNMKLIVSVKNCVSTNNQLVKTSGKLLILYKPKENESLPVYGQLATCNLKIQPIPKSKNPYEFDYSTYLYRSGILRQAFSNSNDIIFSEERGGNPILMLADNMRNKSLQLLQTYIKTENERAVIAALSLGYKFWIDEDLRNKYADTGAMHVLAVSGLHTGIISGIILFLLGWIKTASFRVRLFKFILACCALWLFVFITGMSPSVMRAATMFTFIFMAKTLVQRPVNIFNVLSVSAFLLLMYNPYLLFQISFQLSYAALSGILLFQEKLSKLVYSPIHLFNKTWQLITLSISAQLGALPLTIYYFHSLPTYSWLSGIIVVPMAGILLILTLLLFGTSWMGSVVSNPIGLILEKVTYVQNYLIDVITALPYLKSEGLWLSPFELTLLCLILIALATFVHTNKVYQAKIGLGLLYCLLFSLWLRHEIQQTQEKIIVYDFKKHTIIDYFEGRSCYCISDLPEESPHITRLTKNNRLAHGVENCPVIHIDSTFQSNKAVYKNGILMALNNHIMDVKGRELLNIPSGFQYITLKTTNSKYQEDQSQIAFQHKETSFNLSLIHI
jgi:competence protein ComEC